jgi:hypothetical protein
MATATIQDYRRTDLRTNALETPYWISSAVVDGATVSGLKDKASVLFSFPKAGQKVVIWDLAVQIITGFTATTVVDIGIYTLLTDAVTTAGDATLVDVNYLVEQGDITATTAGWYYPTTSAWLTARAAGTHVANANIITGIAAVVPAVVATFQTGTIIIGKFQLHMMVSVLPGT